MVRWHQTSDVQLHIWKSRDSGFDASHRPGMTTSDAGISRPVADSLFRWQMTRCGHSNPHSFQPEAGEADQDAAAGTAQT